MAKPFTKKGWHIFEAVAAAIDIVQMIITPTGVGAAINEIADPVIDVVFGLIYWRKGAMNAKSFMALVISIFGEEVSISEAPLWVLDVWYTSKTAPPSEEDQATAVTGMYMASNNDPAGPPNQNGVRRPDNANQKPLNIRQNGSGVRPPSPPVK